MAEHSAVNRRVVGSSPTCGANLSNVADVKTMGIGWVHGGNHSITAGILQAKGRIKPEIAYDISAVYKHVVCDGIAFRRSHDNSIIGPVSDLEIAAASKCR